MRDAGEDLDEEDFDEEDESPDEHLMPVDTDFADLEEEILPEGFSPCEGTQSRTNSELYWLIVVSAILLCWLLLLASRYCSGQSKQSR